MFIWINQKPFLKIIHIALSKPYCCIVFFTKAVTLFPFFFSWQQSHRCIIKNPTRQFPKDYYNLVMSWVEQVNLQISFFPIPRFYNDGLKIFKALTYVLFWPQGIQIIFFLSFFLGMQLKRTKNYTQFMTQGE